MDMPELTTDELDDVAGGLAARPGILPHFPPSTGPTIPVDPDPVIVYL
jgi:hypothetical protein